MYPLPKAICINCKRAIPKQLSKGSGRVFTPKVCPSCSKPIASRASNSKMRRSK